MRQSARIELFAIGRLQDDALERRAPAERHVGLAGGECAALQVHDDAVEGLALGLVDGDRPSEAEGKLREVADRFADDAALLQGEPDEVPGMGPDLDEVAAVPELHEQEVLSLLVLLERLDGADAPVDPAPRPVIVEQHHLRAFLEGEFGRGGVVLPAEVAPDVGARDERPVRATTRASSR